MYSLDTAGLSLFASLSLFRFGALSLLAEHEWVHQSIDCIVKQILIMPRITNDSDAQLRESMKQYKTKKHNAGISKFYSTMYFYMIKL